MELYQVITPKPVGIKQLSCTKLKKKANIPVKSFAEKNLRSWDESWSWASSVSMQQKQLKAFWATAEALLPVG